MTSELVFAIMRGNMNGLEQLNARRGFPCIKFLIPLGAIKIPTEKTKTAVRQRPSSFAGPPNAVFR